MDGTGIRGLRPVNDAALRLRETQRRPLDAARLRTDIAIETPRDSYELVRLIGFRSSLRCPGILAISGSPTPGPEEPQRNVQGARKEPLVLEPLHWREHIGATLRL